MENALLEQELQQIMDNLRQYEDANGTDAYSLCIRAQIFAAVGELESAEKSLLNALDLEPSRIETLGLLAAFYSQKGDYAKASVYDGFTAREMKRQGNFEQEKELDCQYQSFSWRQNALYQTAKTQNEHTIVFLSCEPFAAKGRQNKLACAFAEMGQEVSFINPQKAINSAPKFYEKIADQIITGMKKANGIAVYQPVQVSQYPIWRNEEIYEKVISHILESSSQKSVIFLVSDPNHAELLKKQKNSVLIFDFGCQNEEVYINGPWQEKALPCRISMEQCKEILTNSIPLFLQRKNLADSLTSGPHYIPDGKTLKEIQKLAEEKGFLSNEEIFSDFALDESWLERAGHILRIAENRICLQETPAIQLKNVQAELDASPDVEQKLLSAFSHLKDSPQISKREIQTIHKQNPTALSSWLNQWVSTQGAKRKKVLLNAWGGINLGDDLFIRFLCKRYPDVDFYHMQFVLGTVDSLKSIPNLKFYDKSQNHKKSCLVTIGGSLFANVQDFDIQDLKGLFTTVLGVSMAEAQRRPWYILGTNFGPYKSEQYFKICHKSFKAIKDICFRDKASFDLFSDLPNIRWAPDILFQYPLPKMEKKKKIVISCIGNKDNETMVPFDMVSYLNALAHITSSYIEMGYQVTFASFCSLQKDQNVSYAVIERIPSEKSEKTSILEYTGDAEAFLKGILDAEYIIATRFHAMIFAWKAGIPVFPIVYNDKAINAIRSYGYQGNYCYFNDLKNLSFLDVDKNRTSGYSFDCSSLVLESEKHFQVLDTVLKP